MQEFTTIYDEIISSDTYKKFKEKQPDYNLAHGFLQLNGNFLPSDAWQVGFYSEKNDNLAVFETNPIKLKGIEEAFKDGGTIDTLMMPIIPTNQALDVLKTILAEKYPQEQVNSIILIVQSIGGQAMYNITVVSATFSMIIMRLDAKSGEIISHDKRSILDLKQEDK
ncbi:hypothetical protein K9M74_04600 [Candidatus Woesearchaeota archaeon]|nr:hypothetical protein [Candidatus Woesearchaeota archaeon]